MEKIIQEHLGHVYQFSLIKNILIVRTEDENYDGEDEDTQTYTFSNSTKYFYSKDDRKELIYQMVGSFEEIIVELYNFNNYLQITTNNKKFAWENGMLDYEIFKLNDDDEREIHYSSNKIDYMQINYFIIIEDLEKYLKNKELLPFNHKYTYDDLRRIFNGEVDLASKKGDNFAYIDEDKKVVMVGYHMITTLEHHYYIQNEIFYEYLDKKRDINELITEVEKLRKDFKHYNSPIIRDLTISR